MHEGSGASSCLAPAAGCGRLGGGFGGGVLAGTAAPGSGRRFGGGGLDLNFGLAVEAARNRQQQCRLAAIPGRFGAALGGSRRRRGRGGGSPRTRARLL